MISQRSDIEWREIIKKFENEKYYDYDIALIDGFDIKKSNMWNLPIQSFNPDILSMIFDLYHRIKTLEEELKEKEILRI